MKKKIILTGGKFNKIHPGHVWLLKKAKKLGHLIVVLAHDVHNKRPYAVSAEKRRKQLEALGVADKVVIGDKRKFVKVVKKYKPNVIVLGYDQKIPDEETSDYIKKHKIKIIKFRKHKDYSTGKMHKPKS